jgi:glycosyltransferase involved in cell wall biosynthesis
MTQRILISAYACEPGKGSEQGVGWNWVLQIARFANVEVITRANNRDVIEAVLPPGSHPRLVFHYYDTPPMVRRIKRGARGLYPYYFAWQIGASRLASRLNRQKPFEYVMALTFGSIWVPTFMHRIGPAFIYGPIGGGEAVPRSMLPLMPRRARFLQELRYTLFKLSKFNPFLQARLSKARAILVRTEETARLIPKRHAHKTMTILETAVSQELLDTFQPTQKQSQPANNSVFKIVYTGRLIGLKNVETALLAVATCAAGGISVKFDIYGDGPLRSALEAKTRDLGLSDKVTFHGMVSYTDVIAALDGADLYLFLSLKEGGVWSLMEAMAASLPVICLKTSGMELITDPACAVRILPETPAQVRDATARALIDLANDPARRQKMAQAARRRIEDHFLWDAKGDFSQRLLAALNAERAPVDMEPTS